MREIVDLHDDHLECYPEVVCKIIYDVFVECVDLVQPKEGEAPPPQGECNSGHARSSR